MRPPEPPPTSAPAPPPALFAGPPAPPPSRAPRGSSVRPSTHLLLNVALIALALLALAVIVVRDGGDGAGVEVVRREAPPGVDEMLVHVAGAVASPGVVRAERGDRVADVIERAGGALPEADLSMVNLALRIRDEDVVRVPFEGDAATLSLIDLNTATPAELETLPGIGPVRARGIVEARPIADVDELVERGLVPASVWEQIRLLVTALPADQLPADQLPAD